MMLRKWMRIEKSDQKTQGAHQATSLRGCWVLRRKIRKNHEELPLHPAYPSAMRRKNSYSKRLQGETLDRRGRTFMVQPVSQTSRQVRKEQLVF